jgi:hypothetical protein
MRIFAFLFLASTLFIFAQTDQQSPQPWQRDWREFGKAIAPFTKRGDGYWEVNQIFERKDIEWTGTVKSIEEGKSLIITMAPIKLSFWDKTTATVTDLPLYPHLEERPGWASVKPGDRVVFRTELLNRTHGMMPVVRKHRILGGEGPEVQIDTYGAAFLRMSSDKKATKAKNTK